MSETIQRAKAIFSLIAAWLSHKSPDITLCGLIALNALRPTAVAVSNVPLPARVWVRCRDSPPDLTSRVWHLTGLYLRERERERGGGGGGGGEGGREGEREVLCESQCGRP